MKTGGQLIVEALEANGVERIFCVPGESYLAVLDALYDSPIRTIVCRQEGGAAMMADCQGKLTGQPGICFVTRGPGATNASAGIHIARQDSIADDPVHRPGRAATRGARGLPGGRLPRLLRRHRQMGGRDRRRRAHSRDSSPAPSRVATSGRPGPVVISLPEDMLTEQGRGADGAALSRRSKLARAKPRCASWTSCSARPSGPSPSSAARAGRRGGRSRLASARPKRGRCRSAAPFRRQMLFDHLHPNYAGDVGIGPNPTLARRHQGSRSGAARRRAHRRDALVRLHAAEEPLPATRRWSMSIPTPANSAASTGRRSRSTPRPPPSSQAFAGLQAGKRHPAWAAETAATASEPISPGRRRPKPVPARCRWVRS